MTSKQSTPNDCPAGFDYAKCSQVPGCKCVERVSSPATVVSVPRSLAERTEAMFRSVDPDGAIAQEWKRALATPSENARNNAAPRDKDLAAGIGRESGVSSEGISAGAAPDDKKHEECLHGIPKGFSCRDCEFMADSLYPRSAIGDSAPPKDSDEAVIRYYERRADEEASQSSTVPIMAWLHAEHGNAYVITDRVKDLWKQVDPRHVENYTVPLYAAPVATPVAAALKDPEWESGPYFYGDPYGWPWPYTAWLIETGSPALYWHSGGTGDGGYIETWKDDAHKALKFRTEENARREMERLVGFGVTKPMRVCGHTFQCGSTPHSAIGARWVLISRAEAHRLVKEDGAIQLMDGNVPFVRQRSMGKEWFRLEAPPLPDKAVDSKAER
jgi:hypothetical protein